MIKKNPGSGYSSFAVMGEERPDILQGPDNIGLGRHDRYIQSFRDLIVIEAFHAMQEEHLLQLDR